MAVDERTTQGVQNGNLVYQLREHEHGLTPSRLTSSSQAQAINRSAGTASSQSSTSSRRTDNGSPETQPERTRDEKPVQPGLPGPLGVSGARFAIDSTTSI